MTANDAERIPLVVDLDGTLLRSDLLVESFFALLSSRPFAALAALPLIAKGRSTFKSKLADEVVLDLHTLPLNENVVAFIKAERAKGRPVYLASAADHRYVEALAEHLGLFEGAFGSDERSNLAGEVKARLLCEKFGEKGFDYIGNAKADEAIWRKARQVLIADAPGGLVRRVRTWSPDAHIVSQRATTLRDYLKALRVQQWLKNLLVFVPAAAGHELSNHLLACIVAFFSFSLCASSVYIINDLLDLRNDRLHQRKRFRPLAAGKVPLQLGMAAVPVLLGGSALLAILISPAFLGVLTLYFALTLLYSLVLKRKMMVDVIALAGLYGTRLLAGSVASGVALSPWLAALSTFLFVSLALVKRCTELNDRKAHGRDNPPGRGYRIDDLGMLEAMATSSGYVSVLVMALYLNSQAAIGLYSHPERLWLICVVMLYWLSRILILTKRNEMNDDPVVFAATDKISLVCGAVVIAIVLASV